MTKRRALRPFTKTSDQIRRANWPTYMEAAAVSKIREQVSDPPLVTKRGCWQINANAKPYPQFRYAGKWLFKHRLALIVHGVEFDPEMDVDHLCRNRACFNPAHLEPVTHGENVRRGRGGPRPDGKCRKGHSDWRYYPSGRACATCTLIRKGRFAAPTTAGT